MKELKEEPIDYDNTQSDEYGDIVKNEFEPLCVMKTDEQVWYKKQGILLYQRAVHIPGIL